MDFINNHDLIVASVSAVIAVIIGFILGNKYRKHLGDSFELSITKIFAKKYEEDYKKADEERLNYYYDNMKLKRENEEVRAIDQRLEQKEASLKKLEEQVEEERKTFYKLKEINRDIRRKDEIEEYENEVKAKKAQKEARRAERKKVEDDLNEYREASKNINKDKPKSPKNDF